MKKILKGPKLGFAPPNGTSHAIVNPMSLHMPLLMHI